jgi:hypothetical protein
MKHEAGMEKIKRYKTRYHRVLFDKDSPFKRHQVVPNKKKIIPRKSKNRNDINISNIEV